ncbi:GAF domain-containing protein [Anaeromassilibacillus sp. 1001302B_160321_C8]|uniref:GAF domain-containing protein n=1 Tax=Anaeromassilibacillus sp. 1001302B_160321_C8 TaxID=2787132 RepID=UPI003FA46806
MPRKGENIYKRKDGRWEGRYIRSYSVENKAKYAYVYGKTYSEVKQKLVSERSNTKICASPRSSLTYNELLDSWLHTSQLNTKESTHARYVHLVNTHIRSISELESGLHTNDDPAEIAKKALVTACAFYDADWAGVIEIDLELNIWATGWWHNIDPAVKKLERMQEFENLMVMPSIIEAIKKQKPIIFSDVEDIAKTSPKEYQVYKRLEAHSIMAVPFGPKPTLLQRPVPAVAFAKQFAHNAVLILRLSLLRFGKSTACIAEIACRVVRKRRLSGDEMA